MTPIEDSQSSEEILGSEENITAPLPSNSGVQIRVRNVSELNDNNEAEATPSNAVTMKRRCLPSWMLSAQGCSANKKKKDAESNQTPESTIASSPSTSKTQLEKNNENEVDESDENKIEIGDSCPVDSSGAIDHGGENKTEPVTNPNEQMEIEPPFHNDETDDSTDAEAEIDRNEKAKVDDDTKVESNAEGEANQKDDAEVDDDAAVASSSNQTASSSNVTIKAEPKDDDNEAVGQVTATSPKDIKPAVKVKKEEATSSTTRVSCRFGIKCYRRNQMHRVEEAHPGDSDYRRPDFPLPPIDTPACPYGDLCYRRNPIHFQQYTHPPSTDFQNNWKIHSMRLRERKKKQQLSKPDSDEEESEDFIDSSEEFDLGLNSDDDEDEEDEDE